MKTYKELIETNKLNEERKTSQAELDAIDWSGFEAMIKSKTGTSIKIKPKINSRGGVEYSSGNIVTKAGVMVGAFKELYIQNFNSGRMVSDTQLAIDAHFLGHSSQVEQMVPKSLLDGLISIKRNGYSDKNHRILYKRIGA